MYAWSLKMHLVKRKRGTYIRCKRTLKDERRITKAVRREVTGRDGEALDPKDIRAPGDLR